jgi:signal transduction histidine kinase
MWTDQPAGPQDGNGPPDPAAGVTLSSAPQVSHAGPRQLGKLLETVISLGSELDLSVVLRRIAEAGVELTGAGYGALGVLDEQHTALEEFITVGVDDDTRQRIGTLPKGRGLLGALIGDARPLRVADLREHSGRSGFPPEHPPMTSFLGVPIRIRDEVFGNLYLTDKRDDEVFTDIDEELTVALASAAGVAIDNARLVDQLRRREAALAAIQEVANAVLGGADPAQSLRFVAERARVLANADLATFALPAPDGETLVIEVVDGQDADLSGARFPQAGSVSGDVLRSGQVAVIADLSQDPRRAQPQLQSGRVGPAIFVALTAGGKPFGTLFVGRARRAPAFTVADVDMVRSFAAQAGVVLDAAAQRRQLSRLSLLEEQERIARDLHDTVIQQVFAVGLALQGAVGMATDHPIRPRIQAAVENLDEVIRRIRTVIFEVESASSTAAPGLRGEVLAVAREVSRLLGFEPAVNFDGPVDTMVDAEKAKQALAIVREALSNVARHAQATHVEIAIAVDTSWLIIRVADNGIGLPLDTEQRGGRGLRNMRTRADQIGGQLRLGSGPQSSGTVIECTVPLP